MSISSKNLTSKAVASSNITALSLGGSGGASFNPTQVAGLSFGFDASDTDTITTDLSGTTPVTADGDLVRYVGDLSTNGYNATQSTDSRRATYNTDGTYHWITFSGVNDINFDVSPSVFGAVGSDNWACFGVRFTLSAGRYVIGSNADNGFEMMQNAGAVIRCITKTSSGLIAANGSTNTLNADIVFTQEWDRSAGTLKGWQNQNLEVNTSGTAADKVAATSSWLGGGFSATAGEFFGRMYCGYIFDTIPSASDRASIEAFVAAKMGVSL